MILNQSIVASESLSRPKPVLTDTRTYTAPDVSLISELYDAIKESPPGLGARKLLIEHLLACGELEAARDAVQELRLLDPTDGDAQTWYIMLSSKDEPGKGAIPAAVPRQFQDIGEARKNSVIRDTGPARNVKTHHWEISTLRDLLHLRWKGKGKSKTQAFEHHVLDPEALEKRSFGNKKAKQLSGFTSARIVSQAMEKTPANAMEIAIQDLIDMTRWLQHPENQLTSTPLSVPESPAATIDNDAVREVLVKRVQALTSALPLELQPHASSALMHVEHEILHRKYVCDETMLGDAVSDIPRHNFWVSEDGYPWDMEELAQAIASAGGVMRNPLSRQMFTPTDVLAIVNHPLGKRLAALQLEQKELKMGVRLKTIEYMEVLSAALLADNTPDQLASRRVVDEFLAYVATLPESERKAVDGLRVPARDTHTGQAFDSTIGEAVRDAQGNRVCIHKTGDFIEQAARYLRRNH